MTPNLIGTLTFPASQPITGAGSQVGPFFRGGFGYLVCEELPDDFATVTTIVVYKTPDNDADRGIVWTRVVAGPVEKNGRISVYYPGTGNLIYCGYKAIHTALPSVDITAVTFDMDTESFGAPDVVANAPNGGVNAIKIVKKPNGDLLMVWDKSPGTNVFASLNTGTWSAPFQVNDATPASLKDVVIVADDNIKVLWSVNSPIDSFHCATINNVTVTGNVTAYTRGGTDFLGADIAPGVYDADNDLVAWNFVRVRNGVLENDLFCLIGSPASSATPTFAAPTTVYTDLDTLGDIFSYAQLIKVASGFRSAWIQLPGDGSGGTLFTSDATALGGPWSVPSAFWSMDANPPVPPAVDNTDIFPLYSVVMPNGQIGYTLGLLYRVSSLTFCGVLFFLASPGGTISLACPVSNTFTVGTPYSGSLIVTGGTGPFTYAIVGGALPPGLSLNASTGVISGTPTSAGDFSYTAQVTDANDLTATAGCMLSGSSVPVTSPCGEIIPVPSTDVKFELRRVYASMKPAPRLPVRGG